MHRLDVPAPHLLPFALGTFDTIGPLSRASFPHRHSFHEVVYVAEGSGRHVVDSVCRPLRPPQLCVIWPGQVHHWELSGQLSGWVVLFNPDFLLTHPEDEELLRSLSAQPLLPLSDEQARGLTALLREMREEHEGGANGHRSVLESLLHVLLVRAARSVAAPAGGAPEAPDGTGRPPVEDRARELARDFLGRLALPDGVGLSVGEHAARLGVSGGYLTESVKRATGRTPSQLLREARVREAKRLLVATELSVRRVAGRVGYPDPAYFCRFFRRETGISPGAFRRAGRLPPAAVARPADSARR
ncbi:AraC family transcriptional regulator [Streptomyces sp. OF3]|uniref:AraC family transcriptional regulator n=1 Tax=Streptomyces alkaliterrae TaxID=2213162 RepID=A0A5P0YN15_9ACTN|nr:AraC family transcriptional regulator [Streptomyces alkaliterrae]MBB1259135.1 AraC family transcriptional regulator [Streptomyces alkaliterrae]MQS01686.1 helix-turn-helix domain-containing protein [Streptomyces alkaliterrae]